MLPGTQKNVRQPGTKASASGRGERSLGGKYRGRTTLALLIRSHPGVTGNGRWAGGRLHAATAQQLGAAGFYLLGERGTFGGAGGHQGLPRPPACLPRPIPCVRWGAPPSTPQASGFLLHISRSFVTDADGTVKKCALKVLSFCQIPEGCLYAGCFIYHLT